MTETATSASTPPSSRADLLVNEPLGLNPRYTEFKRTYPYPVNPAGFGAMAVVVSTAAFCGAFGELARAFSPFLALLIAMTLCPLVS